MSELTTMLALGMMGRVIGGGVFEYREPMAVQTPAKVSPVRMWLGSVLIALGRRVQPHSRTRWTGMREAAA